MAVPKKHVVLMLITFLAYVVHLLLNGLASRGITSAFPYSPEDVSNYFKLDITPVGGTFSIWWFIIVYQLIWQIYTLTTIYRRGEETNILSIYVSLFYLFHIVAITTWLFLWARRDAFGSLVCVALGLFFLAIAIGYSTTDLNAYLKVHEVVHSNKVDVWCQRLLVQNGLMFNASWLLVATILNLSIFIAYPLEASTLTSSFIGLSILGVLEVVWFLLENWFLVDYVQYMFTNYISIMIGLGGILKNVSDDGPNPEHLKNLVLGMLIITCALFVLRIGIIFLRWQETKEKPHKEEKVPMVNSKTYV